MRPAGDALAVVLLHVDAADAVVAQELVPIEHEHVARQICRHVDAVHLRGVAAAAEVVAGPVVRRADFGIDPVLHPGERLADGRASSAAVLVFAADISDCSLARSASVKRNGVCILQP